MYVLIVLLPDAAGAESPAATLAARLNALDSPGDAEGGGRVVDFAPRRPIRPSSGKHYDVELLGVFRTPEALLSAAVLALRTPGIALSIGAGPLDGQNTARAEIPVGGKNAPGDEATTPEGGTNAAGGGRQGTPGSRDLSGPALGYARAGAEELARLSPSRRASAPLRVEAEDAALAQATAALLHLVARQIRERTDAQWRVVDLLVPGVRGQHGAVAQSLGISVQAVSRTLIRTGWAEEQEGLAAAAELLRRLDTPARG